MSLLIEEANIAICLCSCCQEEMNRRKHDRPCNQACSCGDFGPDEQCDCPFCQKSRGMHSTEMGPTERYEALAERFYKDTGIMAPGKDSPPGFSTATYEERIEAWEKWLAKSGAAGEEQDV